ncbi:MAG: nitroreductase [Flavobacteriales bacterium]|nr:nitroreductase [Flavobacteriales bacterium]MBK7940680.1 nitroreductase [Flavobacteriales bacterium]MBK8949510.1 nitroreductase [Flavobacteriales bacterium]MBK9700903.1 nitroreductase [Flavobacteriales bacterium]
MRHSVSDLTAVIRDRRTIHPKDMSDRVVQRDMVELILSNGTWAPNHGMTQPWRFIVFAADARQRLSAFMGEEYTRITPPEKFMPRKHENAVQRPLQASVVVALGLARDPRGKISELEEQLALACAVQNMHLTCTAYGLGGFWGTGAVVTGDGMRRFLGLADGDRCMGLFYIGYPAADWPKGYRKPLPDVMSWQEV